MDSDGRSCYLWATVVTAPTIVIPTWQRSEWLRRCLEGVTQQDRKPEEVLVVGRAEDVDARGVVRDMANALPVRWLDVDRPGHIPPVRLGLGEAQGEIIGFLDDDAEPLRGWLSALLEPFADPTVACVGGRVITSGIKAIVHPDAGRIRWYGRNIGNVGSLDVSWPVEVDGVMECDSAWRVGVLRSLAFEPVFDADDSVMYGLDLALQAKKRGHRILYQPAARVLHHVAPREPDLDRADRPRRTITYSRNYTFIALRHFRGVRRAAFLAWWWGVGERGAYGLATGVWDLASRREGVREVMRSSLSGKSQGVRAWRRHRASSESPRIPCVARYPGPR